MTSAHPPTNTFHPFLIVAGAFSSLTLASVEGITPVSQTSSQEWAVEHGRYRGGAAASLLTGLIVRRKGCPVADDSDFIVIRLV
jgi:hypothetical protein